MSDPEIAYDSMMERLGYWDIDNIPECGNTWTTVPELPPLHNTHTCRLPVNHSMSINCECECGESNAF